MNGVNTVAAQAFRLNGNNGYYDEVGGYHCEAIGYDPHGNWCGECCRGSCASCPEYTKKEGA